jgi:hypothetical protein
VWITQKDIDVEIGNMKKYRRLRQIIDYQRFQISTAIIGIIWIGWDYAIMELQPLTSPLSIPQIIYDRIWSSGGMILTGENRRTRRKTCPSTTLFTTNPTWARTPVPAVRSRRLTNSCYRIHPYQPSVSNRFTGTASYTCKPIGWSCLSRVRWMGLFAWCIKGYTGLLEWIMAEICRRIWMQQAMYFFALVFICFAERRTGNWNPCRHMALLHSRIHKHWLTN